MIPLARLSSHIPIIPFLGTYSKRFKHGRAFEQFCWVNPTQCRQALDPHVLLPFVDYKTVGRMPSRTQFENCVQSLNDDSWADCPA